jgi:hypothetical protein
MLLYPRMPKRMCLTPVFVNFGSKAHEHSHVLTSKAYPFCVKNMSVHCWLWNISTFSEVMLDNLTLILIALGSSGRLGFSVDFSHYEFAS